MLQRTYFTPQARERAASTIADVEKHTSAEIVIAVHARAGRYPHARLIAAAVITWIALLVQLFEPHEYDIRLMPIELLGVFVVASLLCGRSSRLVRALTPASWRRDEVKRAARAAFVDLGVSRTSGRNGVLVYVAMLERAVEVVADVGVNVQLLGAPWTGAIAVIAAAVSHGDDVDRFLAGVRALGPILGAAMPRRDDDVNELPDRMETP